MDLERVLEIAKECVENEIIPLEGLTLMYTIDKQSHRHLDEELFYKTNNNQTSFEHNEVIEVTIGGITFIFNQK
tara:strand:+ start:1110 stop:1331 length:222 start_codon:yes stop_codon:yes gene_type:complete